MPCCILIFKPLLYNPTFSSQERGQHQARQWDVQARRGTRGALWLSAESWKAAEAETEMFHVWGCWLCIPAARNRRFPLFALVTGSCLQRRLGFTSPSPTARCCPRPHRCSARAGGGTSSAQPPGTLGRCWGQPPEGQALPAALHGAHAGGGSAVPRARGRCGWAARGHHECAAHAAGMLAARELLAGKEGRRERGRARMDGVSTTFLAIATQAGLCLLPPPTGPCAGPDLVLQPCPAAGPRPLWVAVCLRSLPARLLAASPWPPDPALQGQLFAEAHASHMAHSSPPAPSASPGAASAQSRGWARAAQNFPFAFLL